VLICDDLIKNRQDVESEVIRERTWDGLVDDAMTRLEPGGAVIIVATRWQKDDPTGRILERFDPDSYVRLRLPALAEENDVLGRQPGEALWPARYPRDRLLTIQERMGPYSWSALYQQNPVPAEGGIFKRRWFTIVQSHSLPNIVRRARFWDLAMSSKTSADYTVGTLMGEGEDGHFYILDVQRVQKEWGDVVPWMAEVILGDGPHVTQGLEEKGYMSRAVTDLNADARLHSYTVWGYPKDTDKLTNALPFAAKSAASLIHLLAGHWNETWLDEITSFTGSGDETDDQVDSAAGAYNMMSDGAGAEFGEMIREDNTPIGGWWSGYISANAPP
jgi:predicted phage terminase large subunit-like protein